MSGTFSYLSTALLLVIPLAGFTVIVAFFVPQVFGHDDSFIVRSDSMAPQLEEGDFIFTDEVKPEKIREGDIVTFRRDHKEGSIMITHRVVEVRSFNGTYYFKTKGDANNGADEGFIDESRVVGVVKDSYRDGGKAVDLFRSELGFLLIIIPSILLIIKEFSIINRELRWERLNKIDEVDDYTGNIEVKE